MISRLLRIKPMSMLSQEAGEQGEHTLKRSLGAVNLITLGIGAVIGAGIFVLTGQTAALYAGPAVALSFVLAGLTCAFAGLCYSEFASIIPIAGSAYTYGYATLGELVAWIIGWDLVLLDRVLGCYDDLRSVARGQDHCLFNAIHVSQRPSHFTLFVSGKSYLLSDLNRCSGMVEANDRCSLPRLLPSFSHLVLLTVFPVGLPPGGREKSRKFSSVRPANVPDLNDVAIGIAVRECEPIGARG